MVSFDFRGDSLTIYDGGRNTSPMLGNPYCGNSLPPSQTSSSNQLFFHFQSDQGTGFILEYNATSKNPYKVKSCALRELRKGLGNCKKCMYKFSQDISFL
jgi:hypothetical protein